MRGLFVANRTNEKYRIPPACRRLEAGIETSAGDPATAYDILCSLTAATQEMAGQNDWKASFSDDAFFMVKVAMTLAATTAILYIAICKY